MLNAPPMTPVATTERVSRYTQNVSANHRNELVTPVTSVLTSSRRNTGGIGASIVAVVGRRALMPVDVSTLVRGR